jgi:predicted GNAT family acetyltransferase
MQIADNAAKSRFETTVDGETASLLYRLAGDTITLVHTEVPVALGGRGIGGELARAALDSARARGLKVVPTCPFVRAYIARHPEYADLVAP